MVNILTIVFGAQRQNRRIAIVLMTAKNGLKLRSTIAIDAACIYVLYR